MNKKIDFFQNWRFKKNNVKMMSLSGCYETQVLKYLRLTGIKLGLLVNFGAPYVKDGVSRIINCTPVDFFVP